MKTTKNKSLVKSGLKKILKPYTDRLLRAAYSVYCNYKMKKDIEWYPSRDGSDYFCFCENVHNVLSNGQEYYSQNEKKGK